MCGTFLIVCRNLINVLMKLEGLKSDAKSAELLFQTHPTPSQRIDMLSIAFSSELEAAALPVRTDNILMKISAP